MRALDFGPDLRAARDHLDALEAALVRRGRPALPYCDNRPKWGLSGHRGGLCPDCPCESRDAPDPACLYVTRAHVALLRLPSGAYVVPVAEVHDEVEGDEVEGVTLTTATARELTPAEQLGARPG